MKGESRLKQKEFNLTDDGTKYKKLLEKKVEASKIDKELGIGR